MVVLTNKITGNEIRLPACKVTEDNKLITKISKMDIKIISWVSAMDFFKNFLTDK